MQFCVFEFLPDKRPKLLGERVDHEGVFGTVEAAEEGEVLTVPKLSELQLFDL